jgi:mRNA interferase RelE/StbE
VTDLDYSERAVEHLEGLEREHARRLVNKLEEACEWTEHRLRTLSGTPYYSVRAGDYRAIVDWDRENDVLLVKAAGHRRNIYDRYL